MHGCTALYRAAMGGHRDVTWLLLDHGADPCQPSHSATTPLMAAAGAGSLGVIRLLLFALQEKPRFAEALDAQDGRGRTALWHAAAGGHTAVVALLLSRGADPMLPDAEGRLPREVVPRTRRCEGCWRLLEVGRPRG